MFEEGKHPFTPTPLRRLCYCLYGFQILLIVFHSKMYMCRPGEITVHTSTLSHSCIVTKLNL